MAMFSDAMSNFVLHMRKLNSKLYYKCKLCMQKVRERIDKCTKDSRLLGETEEVDVHKITYLRWRCLK